MLKVLSKPIDLRIQRTLQRIRHAFLELLEVKSFDQITVSAVSERAQINRATFYRHYTDIYDLAQQITEQFDAIQQVQKRDTEDLVGAVRAIFEHVADYASFYRAMIRPDAIPGFRARMEETVAEQFTMLLPTLGFKAQNAAMPPALVIRYLAAAQVAFVQWWLEEGMPFSAEEAATYLIQLHTAGSWQVLGLEIEASR
ncbi:TetR family transcriptional regulator [bacterium]|nr:TetR family transcriptional regulator [bacterium]